MRLLTWIVVGVMCCGEAMAGVWVAGPSKKVLRNEAAAPSVLFEDSSKTVVLHAAGNEFVSFQMVFSGDMADVNVGKLTLKGPGKDITLVDMFREHYVAAPLVSRFSAAQSLWDCGKLDQQIKKANAPREFPVQMVPLGASKYGAPFAVKAGKNEVVWVDIFVPEGQTPGDYTGTVTAGGTTLNVKLTVWNFALPSVNHFPQWAMISPEFIPTSFGRPQRDLLAMRDMVGKFVQIAHDHRLILDEEWYGNDHTLKEMPFYEAAKGSLFTGPFGAGFGQELIPIASDQASGLVDLIKKEGWLNRAFVMTGDEPNDKDAYEAVIKIGQAAKQAGGGAIKTFITEQYEPSDKSWPRLDAGIDIFCSGGTPPDTIPAIETKGKVVWTYNSGYAGACAVDAPGAASRTQAWAGFVSGSRVWFFWDAVYIVDRQNKFSQRYSANPRGRPWMDNPKPYRTDVWNNMLNFDESLKPQRGGKLYGEADAIRINGDGLLLYAGNEVGIDGPIADFRMKNIRQGGQDFEYMYLLDKMGQGELAKKEAMALLTGQARIGGTSADGQSGEIRYNYDLDGNKWDQSRIRLGEALNAIGDAVLREKIKPYNQYPNPVGDKAMYNGKRY